MRKYYGKETDVLSPILQSDTDSQDTHKRFPLLLTALGAGLLARRLNFHLLGFWGISKGKFLVLNILAGKYSNLEERNVLDILSCALFQYIVDPDSL